MTTSEKLRSMSEEELSRKFYELTDELVPNYGNCKTIEGEIIRAINKLEYRLLNDRDFPHYGYGRETSRPALLFLCNHQDIPAEIREVANIILNTDYCDNTDHFSSDIDEMKDEIVFHILAMRANGTPFTQNKVDMFDYADESCVDDDYEEEEEEEEEE